MNIESVYDLAHDLEMMESYIASYHNTEDKIQKGFWYRKADAKANTIERKSRETQNRIKSLFKTLDAIKERERRER